MYIENRAFINKLKVQRHLQSPPKIESSLLSTALFAIY